MSHRVEERISWTQKGEVSLFSEGENRKERKKLSRVKRGPEWVATVAFAGSLLLRTD